MTVGKSSKRTLGKHTLLNRLVGREAGSLGTTAMRSLGSHPWTLLDLCAGDGVDGTESGTSSPKIMLKHASFRTDNATGWYSPGQARVHLFERDRDTYQKLHVSLSEMEYSSRVLLRTYRSDSLGAGTLLANLWDPEGPLFINNDPNSINGFAISPELLSLIPEHTTTLSALGCNASGIKRMSKEDRQGWFQRVVAVCTAISDTHDALLVVLSRDTDQWSYLITGPSVWSDQYKADATTAFKTWSGGVTTAWYKKERAVFLALCRELFLTREERGLR